MGGSSMKKLLSWALGATALAGLSIGPAFAKDLTITTWTATSPGLEDWWRVLEQNFEGMHPDVDVKIENIAFADYIRTLTTRLVAGSPPTIIHVPLPTINLAAWADAGFLLDIGDRVAETDIPANWPASQAAMEWNGNTYGVLLVAYGYVFFVNERMFVEAGIAIPSTPEEMLAAAQALTGDGKYGFAVTDDNTVNFMRDALEFVIGYGGEWVKDGAWNFTDPNVVAAIEMWRELATEYGPTGTDIAAKRQAFYDGNVAMMIENPSVWPNVATAAPADIVDDLHLAPMPFEVTPGDVSHGFSIPEGLGDEDIALGWEFTEFAASPEMMRSYVELVKSPVTRPGADRSLREDPDTTIIAEAAADAVPLISNDYYGVRGSYAEFSTALTNALRTILQGNDVAETLSGLEQELTSEGIQP